MRRQLVLVLLGLGLVPAASLAAAEPAVVSPMDSFEAAVVTELNAVRVAHGLRPLGPSPALAASSASHTHEMVTAGYFAHESADGTPFWVRIRQFYPRGKSGRRRVGENLLWKVQSVTARDAVRAWLRSPSHRENVLRRQFREVGVSAVRAAGAPGIFGNRQVVVLTVDFGAR